MNAEDILVVSGLPRSGTSLVMQMLKAGGVPVLSDGRRPADTDNPRGYYELEAVKKLKEDASWLGSARGHAVKAISMLLYDLPPDYSYRVIFMVRNLDEVLVSQREMLQRRGSLKSDADDGAMKQHFEAHLEKIRAWLALKSNFTVMFCDYRELLRDPVGQVHRLAEFLGGDLDQQAMIRSIDRRLYRNRAGNDSGSSCPEKGNPCQRIAGADASNADANGGDGHAAVGTCSKNLTIINQLTIILSPL